MTSLYSCAELSKNPSDAVEDKKVRFAFSSRFAHKYFYGSCMTACYVVHHRTNRSSYSDRRFAGKYLILRRESGETSSPFNHDLSSANPSEMPRVFRASVVQCATPAYDLAQTLAKLHRFAKEANAAGSELVVFPEALSVVRVVSLRFWS